MCEGANIAISQLILRTAQGTLYVIIRRYKKWAPLVLPTLITSLKETDMDTVKGALHTLRLSTIEHALARNWEYIDQYVLALFEAYNNFDRVYPFVMLLSIAIGTKSLFISYYFLGSI